MFPNYLLRWSIAAFNNFEHVFIHWGCSAFLMAERINPKLNKHIQRSLNGNRILYEGSTRATSTIQNPVNWFAIQTSRLVSIRENILMTLLLTLKIWPISAGREKNWRQKMSYRPQKFHLVNCSFSVVWGTLYNLQRNKAFVTIRKMVLLYQDLSNKWR